MGFRREETVDVEARGAAAEHGGNVGPRVRWQRVGQGGQLLAARERVAPREVELPRVGVPLVDEECDAVVLLVRLRLRLRHRVRARAGVRLRLRLRLRPRVRVRLRVRATP